MIKNEPIEYKRVLFLRNGDVSFIGSYLTLRGDLHITMEDVLEEVNKLAVSKRSDKDFKGYRGTRFIFSVNGKEIKSVDELKDGQVYVSAASHFFSKIDYLQFLKNSTPLFVPPEKRTKNIDHKEKLKHRLHKKPLTKTKLLVTICYERQPRLATTLMFKSESALLESLIFQITKNFNLQKYPIKKLYKLDGSDINSIRDLKEDLTIAIGTSSLKRINFSNIIFSASEVSNLSSLLGKAIESQTIGNIYDVEAEIRSLASCSSTKFIPTRNSTDTRSTINSVLSDKSII